MGDDDALGPAGGAGGVDDVGGLTGTQSPVGVVDGVGRGGSGVVVEDDHRDLGPGDHRQSLRVGDDARRCRVVEHVGDAVGRVVRVHRQIRCTGLEHGHERDDELDGAGQRDRDDLLGSGARADEAMGEPVGADVQLGVGEFLALEDHGSGVRSEGRLPLDEVGQSRLRNLMERVVPLGEQPLPLLAGEDLHPPDGPLGIGHDGVEQPHEPLRHQLHGGRVEDVRGVFHMALDTRRAAVRGEGLTEVEPEVELGGHHLQRFEADVDAGQVEAGSGVVLEGQHDLEQRVPGHGPGRVEDLHEPLERQVLVGVGREVRLPYPLQQLPERRVARGVRAQYEGVDEEADEIVQRHVGPAGDGRADGDVRTRAEAGQQGGEAGLHHHEHARALLAGERRDPPVQLRVQPQRHRAALVRGDGRAGPVEGEPQLLRNALQRLPPIRDLVGDDALGVVLVAEEFTLPERVVGVLHRQFVP